MTRDVSVLGVGDAGIVGSSISNNIIIIRREYRRPTSGSFWAMIAATIMRPLKRFRPLKRLLLPPLLMLLLLWLATTAATTAGVFFKYRKMLAIEIPAVDVQLSMTCEPQ